ncbi:MAG: acyl-CoA thioesterase [Chloroflexi bacterium]|nr:acyl-CoA thioesterase [Chloroflexota bacterium]
MSKDEFHFHFRLRVRWSETDPQGIVFNARYLDYLEIAQSEYFRNLGILLYDESRRTYFDTATVKITVEFEAPARVDELLDIYSRVAAIGTTSMTQHTEIYRHGTDELLTRGETVYVDYDSDKEAARVVPDDVRELIEHFERTGEVLPIERFPNLARR